MCYSKKDEFSDRILLKNHFLEQTVLKQYSATIEKYIFYLKFSFIFCKCKDI